MKRFWNKAIAKNLRYPTNSVMGWFTLRRMVKYNTFLEKNAVELCGIEPHQSVLEVGFGPGIGLKEALLKVKDGPGRVHGLDVSATMVSRASNKFRKDLHSKKLDLEQGSVMVMPYSTSQFDRIFHCNSFMYWPDQRRACRELYRVLKPHSHMVMTLNLQRMKKLKEENMLIGKFDLVDHMTSLELAGFEDVRIEYLKDGGRAYQAVFSHIRDKFTLTE